MFLYDKEIKEMKWLPDPTTGDYLVCFFFENDSKVISIPGEKLIEYSVYSLAKFESDQLIIEYLFNFCGLKIEKVYLQ